MAPGGTPTLSGMTSATTSPNGSAGLIEANDAHRAEVGDDYWDESYVAGAFETPGEKGDWAVVLGFDGGLGMPCAETLSEGGRVVAHSSNEWL